MKGFQNVDMIIPNLQNYDLVAIASQECKKRYRLSRLLEIENYMLPRGFVNIDKDNNSVAMFEMFLITFIKRELATDVSKVKQISLEKGWMNIVGNKGGVAYSF